MNIKLAFGMLSLCGFLECVSKSIIVPFFPTFAINKEISIITVGIILSCNPFGALFASLILGKIITEVTLCCDLIRKIETFL